MTNNISSPAGLGSVVIIPSERHMQMYDLNENEINMISSQNAQSTTAFSIASFLLSQVISIGITIFSTGFEKISVLNKVLTYYGLPIFIIGSIFYFVRGFCLLKSRQSIIDIVKKETKNITKDKGDN